MLRLRIKEIGQTTLCIGPREGKGGHAYAGAKALLYFTSLHFYIFTTREHTRLPSHPLANSLVCMPYFTCCCVVRSSHLADDDAVCSVVRFGLVCSSQGRGRGLCSPKQAAHFFDSNNEALITRPWRAAHLLSGAGSGAGPQSPWPPPPKTISVDEPSQPVSK